MVRGSRSPDLTTVTGGGTTIGGGDDPTRQQQVDLVQLLRGHRRETQRETRKEREGKNEAAPKTPEGPNIETIQDFAPGLKLSSDQSQIEVFNRD